MRQKLRDVVRVEQQASLLSEQRNAVKENSKFLMMATMDGKVFIVILKCFQHKSMLLKHSD